MKRLIVILCLLWSTAQAQTIGQFRYDSVMFTRPGGNSELIILNGSRAVTGGALVNTGNGRTSFQILPGGFNTSVGSGFKVAINGTNNVKSLTASNGLTADSSTSNQVGFKLGGTLTANTTITGGIYTLTQNFTSPSDPNYTININQNNAAGDYAYNINAQHTNPGNNVYSFLRVGTDVSGLPNTNYGVKLDASNDAGVHKNIEVRLDSIILGGFSGPSTVHRTIVVSGNDADILSFPELISSANADDSMLVIDASSKIVGMRAIPGGSSTLPISSLTAATGTNSINNGAHGQEWQWNTLAGTSGLKLSSTSTAATGGTQKLFEISLAGANATSGQATYGAFIANSHTGTTATNYGIRATASGAPTNIAGHFLSTGSHTTNTGISVSATGATTNNAVYTADGDVKLNQVSGETFIGLAGSSLGKLNIGGNTSGTVTIKPAAAAGTWSMTLPTTDGNSGEFLQTDGSGVTSWAAGGGITVGTTTITSGTNKAVPFNDSGVYGEDASVFVWDKTNNRLGIGTNAPAYALDVSSTAAATANFESTAAGNMQVNYNSTLGFNVNFTFQNAGSTQWYIGNDGATNRFRALNASGVDKFSILQDGKTGIGTSTPTSTLTNTGSFALPYHKVTADAYVITASDYTLDVDNDVNDWTITLPDPSTCVGRIYIIKRLDNTSVGRVDISSAGGATVQDPTDGTMNATFNLTGYGASAFSVMYQSTATAWTVLK